MMVGCDVASTLTGSGCMTRLLLLLPGHSRRCSSLRDSPAIRSVVQALGGPDPEGLLSRTDAGRTQAVRCSLVPRAGLGAFTAKAEGGWRIAVHEHTPQLLSAFAALVFASPPSLDALNRILDANTQQAVDSLLLLAPETSVDEKTDLPKAFTDAGVLFILSHEFGHVLLGHETADANVDPHLVKLGLPPPYASALDEIEADTVAALVLARLPEETTKIGVIGARIFFELSHLLNTRRLSQAGMDAVESYLAATHPHPALRLAAVQAYTGITAAPILRLVQEDLDTAIGRPPIVRDQEALAAIRGLSEKAAAEDVQRFMEAMPDEAGVRLDGQLLDELTSSTERAVASVSFAAIVYIDSHPYRWASAEKAVGFAAILRKFLDRPGVELWRKEAALELLTRAIPELNEVLDLETHIVHWV